MERYTFKINGNIILMKDNLFGDNFYKLYNSDGEITDKSTIKYRTIIKGIRDAIAHGDIAKYISEDCQEFVVVRLQKNLTMLMDHTWYKNLLYSNLQKITNEFKYIYVPIVDSAEIKTSVKVRIENILEQARNGEI